MQMDNLIARGVIAMLLLLQTTTVMAADVKVISTTAVRPILTSLTLPFEQATGHKLTVNFVSGPDLVRRQIETGEAFDVAVSIAGVIDELAKGGKIASSSRADFARAGIGVGVRAGAAKPDIGSVDGFKRALTNARSVAYATEGRSGSHFLSLLERFGMAQDMAPKLKPMTTVSATEALTTSEVDLAVLLVPGIISAAGVELAGPLPAELQNYLRFAAGAGTNAPAPDAALAFVRFLLSPGAAVVIQEKGMEPTP
jgi:molybdate transport system substrate-binding protein